MAADLRTECSEAGDSWTARNDYACSWHQSLFCFLAWNTRNRSVSHRLPVTAETQLESSRGVTWCACRRKNVWLWWRGSNSFSSFIRSQRKIWKDEPSDWSFSFSGTQSPCVLSDRELKAILLWHILRLDIHFQQHVLENALIWNTPVHQLRSSSVTNLKRRMLFVN